MFSWNRSKTTVDPEEAEAPTPAKMVDSGGLGCGNVCSPAKPACKPKKRKRRAAAAACGCPSKKKRSKAACLPVKKRACKPKKKACKPKKAAASACKPKKRKSKSKSGCKPKRSRRRKKPCDSIDPDDSSLDVAGICFDEEHRGDRTKLSPEERKQQRLAQFYMMRYGRPF